MPDPASPGAGAPGPAAGGVVIAFRDVTKRFGSTAALSAVSLQGHAGSVHAVTGENGAGKSTLMKLLAGVHRPDEGEILLNGRAVAFSGPGAALHAGISTVFQELTLLPNLSVAENIFLGREPRRGPLLDRGRMRREARLALDRLGMSLDVDTLCGALSVAEQQLIEIAKGLTVDAEVFIFDEPTAALNAPEIDKLEALIGELKRRGRLVFYISHRLDEIFRFCDRVTVLKDGEHVATAATAELDHDRLVALMVGRPLGQLFPARRIAPAVPEPALQADGLVVHAGLAPVDLALARGEILGLAGLEGQGQRGIVRALAGLDPPAAGSITLHRDGQRQRPAASVVAMTRAGVGFVPEERKTEGLYLPLSIEQNMALGLLRNMPGWARARIDRGRIRDLMAALGVRARDAGQDVGSLSGGNQQKVMIGRWLASGVDVLLIEEPTRGVDVGAKADIYALLRGFTEKGGAVLFTSSELTEHLGLCDRILVVRGGAIVAEMAAVDASEERIMMHAITGAGVARAAAAEPA
ncbi:MAG: sugar ABC transporter ATP-binding protein [Sneathiellaceae bacterium]